MEYCSFIENETNSQGSAIYSYSDNNDTHVYISNCTFFNNATYISSGAIRQGNGFMEIVNTLITGTEGGPAIDFYSFNSSRLSITYSDFWDNEDGDWTDNVAQYFDWEGNMSEDPLYVDPFSWDFHLDYDSPCVDTGDPDSPDDPDGSRADIGAWNAYPQPDYAVDLETSKPNGVGAAGSTVIYSFSVLNDGLMDDIYDITFRSLLPQGWTIEYITSTGRHDRESIMSLTSGETYQIDVVVQTSEADPCESGTFEFQVTSQNDESVSETLEFYTHTAGDILIVNGDPQGENIEYYTDAIVASIYYNLEVEPTYSTWSLMDYALDGGDLTLLDNDLIIWHMGTSETISEENRQGLVDYMSNGHQLFISGAYAPTGLYGTTLLSMLGANYQSNFSPQNYVIGEDEDPVADGLVMNIVGGDGADTGYNSNAMRLNGGHQVFFFTENAVAGIRMDGDYKSLILSFPFEAISRQDYRTELMTNILLYFGFVPTSVEPIESDLIPDDVVLAQNYPNPFNSTTRIKFGLPEKQLVQIAIYNTLGQKVAMLANSEYSAGYHTLNYSSDNLASGLYYIRMVAGTTTQTRSMMFIK